MKIPKTLSIGIITTISIILLIYLFTDLPSGGDKGSVENVTFSSADKCASCHKRVTPDIVLQYSKSTMAKASVKCMDCHGVKKENKLGKEHKGFFITSIPTPKQCASCHPAEAKQFALSRHAAPSWVALTGLADFSKEQINTIKNIPEANLGPKGLAGIITAKRNALFDIEGPLVTPSACVGCHEIGKPNLDNSIGNCNKCHLRHEFTIEQVRKPEICGQCHLGPDHPQMEIYDESAHGVMYRTTGDKWNWSQKPGRLTIKDMPAPTCATCHMSGLGNQGTTHDVGQRLSKYLFAAISNNRPNHISGRNAMKAICANCHSNTFIDEFYEKSDNVTTYVNSKVKEAQTIMKKLVKDKIISNKPFAAPISFIAFDLWHYYGRTAKFGAYMQGSDYTQWHGVYPMLHELSKLKQEAKRLRAEKR